VLDVAAPRGDFVLDEGTGPVVLVSAGIGVTPVLAMLHQLAADHSERELWLLYGARGPSEHPFAHETGELLTALPQARRHLYYSKATPAELDRDHAEAGHLTKEKVAALGLPASASAFICGPASFMADMQDALAGAGLDAARIHTELFGTLPPVTPGVTGKTRRPPHQPPGPAGTGPLVTFARSGLAVPFGDGWHSVLDLADACDVPTRWSCRTGVCHTCVTPVLSGDFAYSPDPLEPPADGQVLICCARPRTELVLDL
jgi:ferredoxin-NADP reductase